MGATRTHSKAESAFAPPPAGPSVRRPPPGRMLAVLLAAPFMAQADATIANVATPSIHASLGASGAALELVIGGYLIAFAMLLITGARLGQTHGYRRVFLLGTAMFTLASLACGLAPNPVVLVVARVIQGGAAALMFPQTLTGIQLHFTGPGQRARAIGRYAIALSCGAVTGQIAGGALISANLAGAGWRLIFLINVPIGLLVLATAARWLPADDPQASRRIDMPGVAALSAAVLLLVLPLVLGRAEGWPAWTWICMAASLPAFAVFLGIEKRIAGGSPLVSVGILGRPAVSWALVTLLMTTGTYYGLLFTLAQYLQAGLGRSPLVSGLTLVPWVCAFGLAGQLVRRLTARAAAAVPAVGCLLLAVAYLAISTTVFAGRHGELLLSVLLGAGGLGLGLQFSALTGHLTTAVPDGYASDISGVTSTTLTIGGGIGVAALGTLYLSLASHPAAGARQGSHAYAITAAVLGGVALAAALTARLAASGSKPGQREARS